MRTRTQFLLGTIVAVAPGIVLAADEAKPTGAQAGVNVTQTEQFRTYDKNRDGHISQDEAKSAGLPFASIDQDRDGKISAAELADWAARSGAAGPRGPAGAAGTPGATVPSTDKQN